MSPVLNCPACGAAMVPLFISQVCSKDCHLKAASKPAMGTILMGNEAFEALCSHTPLRALAEEPYVIWLSPNLQWWVQRTDGPQKGKICNDTAGSLIRNCKDLQGCRQEIRVWWNIHHLATEWEIYNGPLP